MSGVRVTPRLNYGRIIKWVSAMIHNTLFAKFSSTVIPLLLLVACGGSSGGGGEGDITPPTNIPPIDTTHSSPVRVGTGVNINDVTGLEGNIGANTLFVFAVAIRDPIASDIEVKYETMDFNNITGADYTPQSGSVIIPAGETVATISIEVTGDNEVEADQVFRVKLTSVNGGVEPGVYTTGLGTIIDDDAPVPANGNLSDGGSYTSQNGIRIDAPGGSIFQTVEVTLQNIQAPTEPLPSGFTPVGEYFSLSIDRDIYYSHENLARLSIPIPDGADPRHLALAMLVDNSDILDSNPDMEQQWLIQQGVFDPDNNEFITPVYVLDTKVRSMIMIEHVGVSTPVKQVISTSFSKSNKISITIKTGKYAPKEGVDLRFFAKCFSPDPTFCTEELKTQLSDKLATYRERAGQLGYPEPGMEPHVTGDISEEGELYYDGYIFYIYEKCNGHGGRYNVLSRTLEICINGGSTEENYQTLLHEYFHALQYAFEQTRRFDAVRDWWIIEGTADAAIESFFGIPNDPRLMHRSSIRNFRKVDTALVYENPDNDPYRLYDYEAQDFWVYTARTQGNFGLSGLIPMFNLGLINHKRMGEFESDTRSILGDTLPELYWSWVKNQVYEGQEKLASHGGSEELLHECSINLNLAPQFIYSLEDEGMGYQYLHTIKPFDTQVHLYDYSEPVEDPGPYGDDVIYGVMGVDSATEEAYSVYQLPVNRYPELRYKIYVSSLDGDCVALEEDSFRYYFVAKRPTLIIVVVSNVSMDGDAHSYWIWHD